VRSISRWFSFVALVACGLWAVVHAAGTLTLDTEKSRIDFVGTKPGGMHRGGFKTFTVEPAVDWSDLSKSRFKIAIDTKSLWSDNNMLTAHLSNADFFDIGRYPSITFETSDVELASANRAIVKGALTMLGKTEEVAVSCDIALTEGSLQAKCPFTIERSRWGMTYGKGRIDDAVEIEAKFVFGR